MMKAKIFCLALAVLALSVRPADAALAANVLLITTCDTSNNTAFVTPSVSPTAGGVAVVAVMFSNTTTRTLSTVTGGGLTWAGAANGFGSQSFNTTGAPTWSISVFTGTGTPSAGALTLTASGATTGACYVVFEITGQHATLPFGSDGVGGPNVKANTGSGTNTSSGALSAFQGATSYTVWIVANAGASGGYSPEAGWAFFGSAAAVPLASPTGVMSAFLKTSNDLTPTSTIVNSVEWGGFGFELAEAAAGGGGATTRTLMLLGVGPTP